MDSLTPADIVNDVELPTDARGRAAAELAEGKGRCSDFHGNSELARARALVGNDRTLGAGM